MAKLTIVEEKPVPPPKKYVLEMTEEEAECLGDIMSFVSVKGPLSRLYMAIRREIPHRAGGMIYITDGKVISCK